MLKLILVTLMILIKHDDAEKILGIFHFPSKSHYILGNTLMKALASRGHQVTMISPFPTNATIENYEHVELTGTKEIFQSALLQTVFVKERELSVLEKYTTMHKQIGMLDEYTLNHTAIQTIKSSNRTFDLVIMVYFGNDAYLGIAHHCNAASVLLSPLGSSIFTDKLTGNPAPYSYVPNKFLPLTDTMNFWERVTNFVLSLMYSIYYDVVNVSRQEYLLDKYFPDSPGVLQLRNNVSLLLLHSHFSTETPRPLLPNMIQVGGLHIQNTNELNEEFRNFMDNAEHGVILFSLGSIIKSSELSQQVINDIVATFSTLPQKVLWKFETHSNVTHFPSNVKVSKWLPQSDILAHSNLKLFVTHGGSLSITEAIYHGVPMVGIPIFGDQKSNVLDAVNKGYAVQVDYAELTQNSLSEAIEEVLNNRRYRDRVQAVSRIIKDQPMKPLDRAIYWIEYVLRHKGAHHLRSSAAKLTWYQYYLLDVLSFLMAIVIGLLCLLSYAWKVCKRILFVPRHKNVAKDKNLAKSKIN